MYDARQKRTETPKTMNGDKVLNGRGGPVHPNLDFLPKLELFAQILDFLPKFGFFTENPECAGGDLELFLLKFRTFFTKI